MMQLRAFLLLALCCIAPAQAGLFVDDDAHKKIQQLEARLLKLEALDLENSNKQTKAVLDLQGQIEALNVELRKLRGQDEELAHGLQDAEKREKDFYVDLDTRLRRLESAESDLPKTGNAPPPISASVDVSDPALENRAIEAAYAMFKNGNHANAAKAFQDFLKKYPDSVHVPNAQFWLGNAQLEQNAYKAALASYRALLNNYPAMPKVADAMLNMASCQLKLKQPASAKKTLRKLIDQHPGSNAAAKAKKLLASIK
jgi:tol-pal system protein YbgF